MQLTGKTALITGANSGLGKAVALKLAALGAEVLMVSRSSTRGESARQDIVQASANQNVRLYVADLAAQQDVRALAAAVKAQHPQIHLLINNVGTVFNERRLTADGIESSLAVNHLAAFLLTNLLLDSVKAAAPARIINVGTRFNTAMDFDDLQFESRPYKSLNAYVQSKLGVIHFTYELARRLEGTGVTVNCVHPGVFRSNLGSNNQDRPEPLWMRILTRVGQPFLKSADDAAERVLYLATSPDVAQVSGRYWGNKVPLESPPQTHDAAANRRLWDISAALTGLDAR